MMPKLLSKIWNYLRSTFFSGLFALLPITLTIVLFHFTFMLIKGWLEPILHIMPSWLKAIPHSEIVVVLFVIFIVGAILKTLFFNELMHYFEEIISSIPVIKPVYASIKQLVTAFGNKDQDTFKQVVLVTFPHKSSYSIGFLTGQLPPELAPIQGKKFYSIFVPATPNPTSGFYLVVTEDDFVVLDLTRQEAMTLLLSGGIILPDRFKAKQ